MDTDVEPPKATRFAWVTKARAWVDQHRASALLIAGAIGIAVVGNVVYMLANKPLPAFIPDIYTPRPKVEKFYSPLTGLEVKNKKATTKPVTAVIIENSPDARPQSGLQQAEIVYEAVAEAGITRFMVFYQQNSPKKIGPVRSIRPYYVEWYQPYNASMAHVGGSKKALDMIRNGEHRDLDQFFNANTYWRVSDRYAPHNVYTSGSALARLNKQKKYTKSKPIPLLREKVTSDTSSTKKPTATKISVQLGGSSLYDSSYRYDQRHDRYIRSQAGVQHKDQQKGVITPKVVIVLRVDESTEFQDTYREVIQTTGSGKATIFQHGIAKKVTWHRKSRASQLYFTNTDGEKVELARGQTWITAMPNNKGDVSWQ